MATESLSSNFGAEVNAPSPQVDVTIEDLLSVRLLKSSSLLSPSIHQAVCFHCCFLSLPQSHAI